MRDFNEDRINELKTQQNLSVENSLTTQRLASEHLNFESTFSNAKNEATNEFDHTRNDFSDNDFDDNLNERLKQTKRHHDKLIKSARLKKIETIIEKLKKKNLLVATLSESARSDELINSETLRKSIIKSNKLNIYKEKNIQEHLNMI